MNRLLQVKNLSKTFVSRDGKGTVRAVTDITFDVAESETLGIVGESGCGKSTLARMLLRLVEPSAGSISFRGEDLLALDRAAMRSRRRDIQIVFQDPYASLDPRMTVAQIIAEPLVIHGIGTRLARLNKVEELLDFVGLDQNTATRYPHEFSGGQRQRIGIARAIALEPKLIVLDEPVSALDVSIQAQILNLLLDLKARLRLSYIFISHDLSVIQHVSDQVLVMYLGRAVEMGTADEVLAQPRHPYTQALISAIPTMEPHPARQRNLLPGDPPNPECIPAGCSFHPRCPRSFDRCTFELPLLRGHPAHRAACHLNDDQSDRSFDVHHMA